MMINLKNNILPNLMFMLAVVVVPLCLMAVASIGVREELLTILGV